MKKVKIIIGVVILLILLSGVAFGVLYLKTDVLDFMKSPKEMFFKYAEKMFEGVDDAGEKVKPITERSYVTNSKVSWKLEDRYDEEVQEILDLANSFTFNVETKNDAKNKASSVQVDVRYDNESLLNLLCAYENSNPEALSLALPDVFDEAITIENRDLKELAEMFGIEDSSTIPDKLEFTAENPYEDLMLTEDQIKEIKDKYLAVIKDSIDEANFERGTDTIEINGEDVDVNSYILTLSEKETLKVLTELLKEFKNDDELLEYIVELVNVTYGDYMPLLYPDDPYMSSDMTITKSDVKDLIDEMISELKDADTGSRSKLKIIVYENNGEAVRFKIGVAGVGIIIDKIVDGDETNIIVSMVEGKNEIMRAECKILDNDKKVDLTFAIIMESEDVEITLKVVANKDGTYEKVQMMLSAEEAYIEFNIENNRVFRDVTIEKMKNTNILNDMTEEELMSFVERLTEAAMLYYEDNEAAKKLVEIYVEMMAASEFNTGVASQAEIQEIEMFNSKFTSYAGVQSASAVKSLMTAIESSNVINDDRQITVYVDWVETDPADVQRSVNSQKQYYIMLEYGYDGYIYEVEIEEE